MPSEKQIRASRANGALSRGPVTEQGKKNSSRNHTRHGLLAQNVVLDEENVSRFQDLLTDYMDEFQPRSATQVSLVEIMAVARWRLVRVWGLQKTAMDRDMSLQDPDFGPAPVRALVALRGSPDNLCPADTLLRYETAFDRQFSRAHARLLALQARPSDREAAPYHPSPLSGETWNAKNTPLPNEPSNALKTNAEQPPQPGSNQDNEPAGAIPEYDQ